MFCPQCGTQNEIEQRYCRQCGLALASVRNALAGRSTGALAAYEKGGGAIAGGAIVLCICVLIAIVNFFLSSGARNYGMLINLLVGLTIALPMIVAGVVRVRRAERLLEGASGPNRMLSGEAEWSAIETSLDRETDGLGGTRVAGSVTEGRTLKLPRG